MRTKEETRETNIFIVDVDEVRVDGGDVNKNTWRQMWERVGEDLGCIDFVERLDGVRACVRRRTKAICRERDS